MPDVDVSTDLRREQAQYIERMVRELSRLSAISNLTLLTYLLDMAAEEAAIAAVAQPMLVAPRAAGNGQQPRALVTQSR
jgi:hypothetical protein